MGKGNRQSRERSTSVRTNTTATHASDGQMDVLITVAQTLISSQYFSHPCVFFLFSVFNTVPLHSRQPRVSLGDQLVKGYDLAFIAPHAAYEFHFLTARSRVST